MEEGISQNPQSADLHFNLGTVYDKLNRFDDVVRVMERVTMRVDPTLDATSPPLTQARVTVRLKDGRALTALAKGARAYGRILLEFSEDDLKELEEQAFGEER